MKQNKGLHLGFELPWIKPRGNDFNFSLSMFRDFPIPRDSFSSAF